MYVSASFPGPFLNVAYIEKTREPGDKAMTICYKHGSNCTYTYMYTYSLNIY